MIKEMYFSRHGDESSTFVVSCLIQSKNLNIIEDNNIG
jgi:hypothetical protein